VKQVNEPFETYLQKYAELIIKVGLNIQAGQRLLITDPSPRLGIPVETAPLARAVAEAAYQAGAEDVTVIWGDERLRRIRYQHASKEVLEEPAGWFIEKLVEHIEAQGAFLSFLGVDPDVLSGLDPARVAVAEKAHRKEAKSFSQLTGKNAVNWGVVPVPVPDWAVKVFPDRSEAAAVAALWEAIFHINRLDRPDPVAVWREHLANLAAWCDTFNKKQYAALHYRGGGTDLTIGLPQGHVWHGGAVASQLGHPFTPNLPTEEIFTLPHKDKIDGVVRGTKPLYYGGALIEGFELKFAGGRVVEAAAENGEGVLQSLLEMDEGARSLGEVALVPHSSPVSKTGLLFYNGILDENAACHLALGFAYPFTLADGEELAVEAFQAAGGNVSLIHVDFMMGSDVLDIDGVRENGMVEPIMRGGEWAVEPKWG
jgi:aminopeptidase